ncbi:hypothetical protein BCR39DRAFT_598284 [Naematelia encephala]|uniref:Uncharacterized protein n=1 Tax=Naematelia encephala TaxID=71784 RepID=A0A1Y2B7K0_9TREE|nr:hypothetical protein BCR39DRAFT_598284 [Naematelia encephala]
MSSGPFSRLEETPGRSWRSFIPDFSSTQGSNRENVAMSTLGLSQSSRYPFASSQSPSSRTSCATKLSSMSRSIRSHAPSRRTMEIGLGFLLFSACVALSTTTGVFLGQRNAARGVASAARDAASVALLKGVTLATEVESRCADDPSEVCVELLDLANESGLLGGVSKADSVATEQYGRSDADAGSMMDVN